MLLDKLFPPQLVKKNKKTTCTFYISQLFSLPFIYNFHNHWTQAAKRGLPASQNSQTGCPPISHNPLTGVRPPPSPYICHISHCRLLLACSATCPPQTLPGDCGGNQITGYQGGERNMIFPECRRLSVWNKVGGGVLVGVRRDWGVALSV